MLTSFAAGYYCARKDLPKPCQSNDGACLSEVTRAEKNTGATPRAHASPRVTTIGDGGEVTIVEEPEETTDDVLDAKNEEVRCEVIS